MEGFTSLGRNRGILLDVDGVLLDSYPAYRVVWARWAEHRRMEFEYVWSATHGRRPVDAIAEIAPHLDAEAEYEWLVHSINGSELAFPPCAGAAAFLQTLPNCRWGLVTSGHAGRVVARFRAAGLTVPKVIVDGSCVSAGKPSPECYLRGAEQLAVHPSQCLAVEDSPAGVCAARDAGALVVAVTTTHSYRELAHAHTVVGSLADASRAISSWFLVGERQSHRESHCNGAH